MKRTATDADMQAIWTRLAPYVVELFNKEGESPQAMLGIRLGPEVGEVKDAHSVPKDVLAMLFYRPGLSDRRRKFLRSLVAPDKSEFAYLAVDVAVMVSEAWYVERDTNGLTPEEEARVIDEGVSAQADKQEAICILLHTLDGEACGFCPIDPVTRKASVGRFMTQILSSAGQPIH